MPAGGDDRRRVRVQEARYEADGVTSYALVDPDGDALAAWEPGAHIDLHLPSGVVRQYSLCSDPEDLTHYRIAVLRLDGGRGGSTEVHRELRPGAELSIGAPRNRFPLVDAPRHVLVAGGIGITPILPMARRLARDGRPFELLYGARSAGAMAFADAVRALGPARVRLIREDAEGRLDLDAVVASAGSDARLYACGPAPMLDALTARCTGDTLARLHLERFAAAPIVEPERADGTDTDAFEVTLARSNVTVPVPAGQSILAAVRGAGVAVASSCEQGICGTCETRVLAGVPDHRDELLTDEERRSGETMMLCVSRCADGPLVLDL